MTGAEETGATAAVDEGAMRAAVRAAADAVAAAAAAAFSSLPNRGGVLARSESANTARGGVTSAPIAAGVGCRAEDAGVMAVRRTGVCRTLAIGDARTPPAGTAATERDRPRAG